ncbi:MAG: hypothetical protein VB835_17170 [Pirellulales bacterium]
MSDIVGAIMTAKLLAFISLWPIAVSSGCAMCDTFYPHGPHNGASYGRSGSVLEPTSAAAIPQTAPPEEAEVSVIE